MTFDERWLYAAIAVVGGFVVGALLAGLARRLLGAEGRRPAIRTVAGPTGTFLFWLVAVTGIVTAIGFTSPDTLRPIPSDVLAWLPGALAAGLIVLAGYAGGGAISAAVGSAVQRAIQHRPAALERAVRWAVMAGAIVLALGNLGVETTSLQILIAATAFSVALSFALLAGLGGRSVAANVASGRALRGELAVGDRIGIGDVDGAIVALRPTVAIVDTGDEEVVVPLSLLLEAPFRRSSPNDRA